MLKLIKNTLNHAIFKPVWPNTNPEKGLRSFLTNLHITNSTERIPGLKYTFLSIKGFSVFIRHHLQELFKGGGRGEGTGNIEKQKNTREGSKLARVNSRVRGFGLPRTATVNIYDFLPF